MKHIKSVNTKPSGDSRRTPLFQLIYFTDPLCSACWGFEPILRRLLLEYGEDCEIHYHMGGLLPLWEAFHSGSVDSPQALAAMWTQASAHYRMPINPQVLHDDPPSSSYPSCIAYKVLEAINAPRAALFLRRIREMLMVEGKNIARADVLLQAATACGFSGNEFDESSFESGQAAFEDDLKLARQLGVGGFPTVLVKGNTADAVKLVGAREYTAYEQALETLHLRPVKQALPASVETLLQRLGSLCLREAVTLVDANEGRDATDDDDAAAALQALVSEGKADVVETPFGNLWRWKAKALR